MRDEDKELQDGEWFKEDDRPTPNKLMDGKEVVAPPSPQPPGPIVRWERFLTVRSLKVLLAEYDDSTRHLVSALLRNCGYEVTAVANGLQAWKILGDLTNHIDLMLTEVSMPTLSGFGLLCKIMNHKTRRNVPVIMMSSNDSMSTVFNCLSKGAVDFLVKPIRKNELKNLWQHVWRRCHSSSGSGSESVIRAQKSSKSKADEDSDNNAGSNDEGNGSIGSNVRDGSDNGSGTQSLCTKRAVELGSPRPISPSHNHTCAQVIHPKPGTIYNERVHLSTNREHQEPMKYPENDIIEKNMEIGVLKSSDTKHKSYVTQKVSTNLTGPSVHKSQRSNPKKDIHDYVLEHEGCSLVANPGPKASDTTAITKSYDNQLSNGATDNPSCLSKSSDGKVRTVDKFKVPSLELSLKRLVSSEEGGTAIIDDRNVLRHSNLSAFSRYNTSASSTQAPTGHGEGCSLLDNSLAATKKKEYTNSTISNSNATNPTKPGSNGSSSNDDMGSTTNNATFREKSSTSMTRCTNPSAVNHFLDGGSQQVMHNKFDDVAAALKTDQPRGRGQHEVRVQHHYHHYHHHHYHVHSTQQQFPPSSDEDKMMLKNAANGSSNASVRALQGNTAHYSLNGSNSGVDVSSDNRNNTAATGGVVNNESDNGDAETGAGDGNMSSNADQNRLTQREAALNKFRLKRKERNFGKKVRYHTRKRLAEQRPRVRGQFVRQIVYEHTSREADS